MKSACNIRQDKLSQRARLNLSRQERLRQSSQFRQIYTRGRKLTGPHLVIYSLPNQLRFNRLGLAVSKKRFKLSVRRHFIQRRLREAYRLNKIHFLPGYDIVLSARGLPKNSSSFDAIHQELLSLAQKAKLLKSKPE